MGPGRVLGSTRYSPSQVPTQSPPRVHPSRYPPPSMYTADMAAAVYIQLNIAVGLKSVAQLSLDALISGFRGMTEVYNLLRAGRINNHFFIPGTD